MTTYAQLLDRVIDDGIAEVHVAYAEPEQHHKRDGAIEGFEACRGKTPEQLLELWSEVEKECGVIRAESLEGKDDHLKRYWKARYKALQVEFVCNVVSAGLTNNGKPPLLSHLPTVRGVMKYAQIVGVRGDGESAS
jgi:hypothetical protein